MGVLLDDCEAVVVTLLAVLLIMYVYGSFVYMIAYDRAVNRYIAKQQKVYANQKLVHYGLRAFRELPKRRLPMLLWQRIRSLVDPWARERAEYEHRLSVLSADNVNLFKQLGSQERFNSESRRSLCRNNDDLTDRLVQMAADNESLQVEASQLRCVVTRLKPLSLPSLGNIVTTPLEKVNTDG